MEIFSKIDRCDRVFPFVPCLQRFMRQWCDKTAGTNTVLELNKYDSNPDYVGLATKIVFGKVAKKVSQSIPDLPTAVAMSSAAHATMFVAYGVGDAVSRPV